MTKQHDFTPGPWTAKLEPRPSGNGHWYIVLRDDGNELGEFYGEDHDANVANLRLAAAAPELYDALEGICAAFPDDAPALIEARAALAKARGEA